MVHRRVEVLHEWKAMADALLDDAACEQRGQQATTDLVLLLQAAVQKACGSGLGLSSGGAKCDPCYCQVKRWSSLGSAQNAGVCKWAKV